MPSFKPPQQKECEAKEKERERAAFRRLAQRDPRPNETKWVEMLGALDGARQRSAEEAEVLREEVRELRASLTQKEAYIAQRHEAMAGSKGRSGADGGGPAVAPAAAGGAGMQQLLGQLHASERALAQAERQAQAAMRRADALETGRREAAARLAGLEEEGGRLRRELQSACVGGWRVGVVMCASRHTSRALSRSHRLLYMAHRPPDAQGLAGRAEAHRGAGGPTEGAAAARQVRRKEKIGEHGCGTCATPGHAHTCTTHHNVQFTSHTAANAAAGPPGCPSAAAWGG